MSKIAQEVSLSIDGEFNGFIEKCFHFILKRCVFTVT